MRRGGKETAYFSLVRAAEDAAKALRGNLPDPTEELRRCLKAGERERSVSLEAADVGLTQPERYMAHIIGHYKGGQRRPVVSLREFRKIL